MRYFLLPILLLPLLLQAQTTVVVEQPNTFKTFTFEFMAGYISSNVVGVEAKQIRNSIRDREDADPDYSGSLAPKSSAYVGILADYRFHRLVGIGTGIIYTPKGYWQINKYNDIDAKVTNFYTVDYFEFPLFLQIYARPKLWLRAGPVFSFAGITKVRIITKVGDDKQKEQYRFGENGSPRAKEFVPGLEASMSFGNPGGFHGTFGIQYSGSMYEDIEIRPVMFRVGFGYRLVK